MLEELYQAPRAVMTGKSNHIQLNVMMVAAPPWAWKTQMSIFRFNSFGWRNYLDEAGVELSGPAEARSQAMRVLGQTLKDHAIDDTDKDSIMVVSDFRGKVICELRFAMTAGIPS